jgi:Ala-tRNA(Pro) deacylase
MIPAAITDYLERHRANYAVFSHPTAYTAQEEAAASHVPGHEWAKTVVCIADDQPILAVVPAPLTVDLNRLKKTAHARSIRLAHEREFGSLYADCELGAMPPLGPLFGQRVFVDKQLTTDPDVTFSAGSHHDAIRMPYRDFEQLVHPAVAEFAGGRLRSSRPRVAAVVDPVCGSSIRAERTVEKSLHRGETYYFCSLSCKMEFDDNPDAYATK